MVFSNEHNLELDVTNEKRFKQNNEELATIYGLLADHYFRGEINTIEG